MRRRCCLGSWRRAAERYPAAVAASLAGLFGFLWWLGIAVETQAGFAGNPDYAVIGVMLVCVSGCAAYGWACVGLATPGARPGDAYGGARTPQGTLSNRSLTWLVAATTLVLLVVFAQVPYRVTNCMPTISSIRSLARRYQARLREEFAALIPACGRRPEGDRLRGRHGRCRKHDDQQLSR